MITNKTELSEILKFRKTLEFIEQDKRKEYIRYKKSFDSKGLYAFNQRDFYIIRTYRYDYPLWVYYPRIGWYKNTTIFSSRIKAIQKEFMPNKQHINKTKYFIEDLIEGK